MAQQTVRFGVEVTREIDAGVKRIADIEDRPKTQMHAVLMRRIVELFDQQPDELRRLSLIRPAFGR